MFQLINLIVSWALFGLIWVIQLVHYPTFHYVAEDAFLRFHEHHGQSITIIVMPLMLAELGVAFWLAAEYQFSWKYLVPLVMVLLIWASTFFIQVPMHNSLAAGKNDTIISQLVSTNWIRTLLWTAKAIWVSWLFTLK